MKVIHGDCLEVMKTLDDNSINCIITDLPFFKVVDNDWDNQWKTENEYLNWVEESIKSFNRILKKDSNIFLFTGRQCNRKIATILDKYFVEKRIIIWARKRAFNNTRGTALASGYEPICYYTNGNGVYNNIKIKVETKRKEYSTGILKDGITLSDVWSDICALPHNSKEKVDHPTQKPIALMERIISIGTNENDVILDYCCGSGSTLLAAKNLNRQYIGIEKEKMYYDICVERLK